MSKPRLLDLGCGAGGCTKGYQLAGFYVVGVDINPQKNYCGDEFYQADMLEFPPEGFDAIHASPPCQTFANVTDWRGRRESHPDLLTPMLERLRNVNVPWIVENVPEACPPLRCDLLLCGSQFGLRVKRHRAFQTNWPLFNLLPSCQHRGLLPFEHKGERGYADAMGCDWMTNREGRQAIPPAFTQHIGEALLEHLRVAA